jgi:hypothetical protein
MTTPLSGRHIKCWIRVVINAGARSGECRTSLVVSDSSCFVLGLISSLFIARLGWPEYVS